MSNNYKYYRDTYFIQKYFIIYIKCYIMYRDIYFIQKYFIIYIQFYIMYFIIFFACHSKLLRNAKTTVGFIFIFVLIFG